MIIYRVVDIRQATHDEGSQSNSSRINTAPHIACFRRLLLAHKKTWWKVSTARHLPEICKWDVRVDDRSFTSVSFAVWKADRTDRTSVKKTTLLAVSMLCFAWAASVLMVSALKLVEYRLTAREVFSPLPPTYFVDSSTSIPACIYSTTVSLSVRPVSLRVAVVDVFCCAGLFCHHYPNHHHHHHHHHHHNLNHHHHHPTPSPPPVSCWKCPRDLNHHHLHLNHQHQLNHHHHLSHQQQQLNHHHCLNHNHHQLNHHTTNGIITTTDGIITTTTITPTTTITTT